MPARYHCGDEERLAAVAAAGTLNGIDFLEVLDAEAPSEALRQRLLVVRLLADAPAGLAADGVRVEGGVRVRPVGVRWAMPLPAVAGAPDAQVPQPVKDFLAAFFAGEAAPDRVVVVHTDSNGDFSLYRLVLVDPATGEPPPAGFDPRLSAVDFSFKVECPTDFDCAPDPACPPPRFAAPPIDYLAKDYAGFRRLMLDRLSAIAPDWRERSPADLGVALVELLAYVADRLSYAQDAAATESYLGTARRRVSVRRHARLVDYALHEGAVGRAWVEVRVAAPGTLPRGTTLLTRTEGLGPRVDPADADRALAAGPPVFETLHDADLRPELDEIRLHTWSDRECCLAAGATAATLAGPLPGLFAGSLLLFEEVIGPRTGAAADADPERRHPVRLTRAEPGTDPLDGTPVVEVEWSAADALPFPLCLSGRTDDDHGAVYLEDVSVARGNLVLADFGRGVAAELPPVPDDGSPYRPLLPEGPLTHAVPLPEGFPAESPPAAAAELSRIDPARALPRLALETAGGEPWTVRRDLLASGRFAADVVAEIEDDGRARLRFGDEQNGKAPAAGTVFTAAWRVGNGTAGNVGRDAIAHVVTAVVDPSLVRNPLPVTGGAEPESLEEARRYAPQAFRVQERAVTAEDYARAAERHPEIARAAATFRWTGSWITVFVTVDRVGGGAVDAELERRLREHLGRFRMAGHDLEIDGPRFVSLDLALHVCVEPGYFPEQVEEAIGAVLGSRDLAGGRGHFHPDAWSFAQPVYLSPIVAAVAAVEGVADVRVERFRRFGRPEEGELADGVLPIGRLEIARLDGDRSFPENGRLELAVEGGR